MATAYIGLGSNLGDSRRILEQAVVAVGRLSAVRIAAVSSVFVTVPVGGVEQPEFSNQALRVETDLRPRELLTVLLDVESRFGRTREVHWGPRTLDLDLLLYDDSVLNTPDLILPHPRLHERGFVLAPLLELAPDLRHPATGETIRDLYRAWSRSTDGPQHHIARLTPTCPISEPRGGNS